jgi:hypothetical protein
MLLLAWGTALVLRSTESAEPSTSTGGVGERPEKLLRAVLMIAWSGGVGFSTAGALVAALSSLERALDGASFVVAWIMLALAAQGALSQENRSSPRPEDSSGAVWRLSAPAVLALFSAAFFWTGDWLGSFAKDAVSVVGPALGRLAFEADVVSSTQTAQLISWAWMVALVLLILLNAPEKILRSGALSWKFAAGGFGVTRGVEWALGVLRSATALARGIVESPRASALRSRPRSWMGASARLLVQADEWLRSRIDRAASAMVEIPSKGLQLFLGGSVQSYLLFTIGFALALLLHFWGHINH